MKYFYNFLIGILMGFGAILPGVSSGVFCVIFGIYEKLVNSIINFFKDFKTNFLFLFPIGLGGIVGVVLFGNVIKYFFSLYKFQSCYAFIGLILGTIPSLFKQASTNKYVDNSNDYFFFIWNCSNIYRKIFRVRHYKFRIIKLFIFNTFWFFNVCWNCSTRN